MLLFLIVIAVTVARQGARATLLKKVVFVFLLRAVQLTVSY